MNNKTFNEALAMDKRAKRRARLWFNLPKDVRVRIEQEIADKTGQKANK